VQAKISMCDISLLFVNGMLEMKFFSFNAMLRSVLSDILFEVGSFKPADDGQYKVNIILLWIIFKFYC
jgi:hypothetical protein